MRREAAGSPFFPRQAITPISSRPQPPTLEPGKLSDSQLTKKMLSHKDHCNTWTQHVELALDCISHDHPWKSEAQRTENTSWRARIMKP